MVIEAEGAQPSAWRSIGFSTQPWQSQCMRAAVLSLSSQHPRLLAPCDEPGNPPLSCALMLYERESAPSACYLRAPVCARRASSSQIVRARNTAPAAVGRAQEQKVDAQQQKARYHAWEGRRSAGSLQRREYARLYLVPPLTDRISPAISYFDGPESFQGPA